MSYNKKTWTSHELITSEALNNIENGISSVEEKVPTKISQLENDSNYVTEEVFEEFANNSVEHIFITEAEYEALSEEDKNKSNVLYLITDIENEYVSLEQYNALLERIEQLELALAESSSSEPEE